MERKIEKYLIKWKNSSRRMPLLINGARQVGKTYSALNFGKTFYRNTAYFNMENSTEITAIFERDLNPERIVRELSAKIGQSIFKSETLIIFDEIQSCERALTALKYFYEEAPEYHIIAVGSLLGIASNREKYSFPVGKVAMITLYPLDFEEFLWATANTEICNLIREAFETCAPMALHETAMDLYKTYLVVGGMPWSVSEYIVTKDFDFVMVAQKTLNDSYIAEMAKYATPHETTKIMAAWSSVPGQLAKENHKFQYKIIKSGARAYDYEIPLDWLKAAGIINKCCHVHEGKMPLAAYADNSSFKLYMADTGLLCSKFDIRANIILDNPLSFYGVRGALTENYVMQALVTNGIDPYYWSSPGKAEVDFVFQDRKGSIIPLEVKSAENVKAKSLKLFMSLYQPPYGIRVSAKNFGYENNIKRIPFYGIFCLTT
ncbi:ATP-binding protein [Acetobacterium bakii]|uniref:ATPase n=1 Tax=Acetobacterium bakii TaxID=52689 RepID=A0A0L6U143_9FIRM|nr:ATP-binding protein [Acetobacterium bakii]KNZ42062.1 ATPase [Acetobacterium bakii]